MRWSLVVLCAVYYTGVHFACGGETVAWLTGQRLEAQLAQPTGVLWSDMPLRQGLYNLGRNQGLAVLLDRRVDPEQEATLAKRELSLRETLKSIAENRKLGIAFVGPVAYFGPLETAARIRTVAAVRMQEAPAKARGTFAKQRAWRWDDLATPRELLEQLAAEAHIEIRGLDRVPHDLWAAADLPALTLVERLTLVLAQFDATFQYEDDGRAISLAEMPEKVVLERTYPGAPRPAELAAKWKELLPDCKIDVVGKSVRVVGSVEDHERIAVSRKGNTTRTKVAGAPEKRYELNVREQPLGPLLKQLAAQLDLEFRADWEGLKGLGISQENRVTFGVKNASLDELLKQALAPAGLTFTRRGKVVDVRSAKAP